MQTQLPVTEQEIANGLQSVKLSGRFQVIGSEPAIILDVTHNPHAAHALVNNLRDTRTMGKTFAVFSMLADKDIEGVVAIVAPCIDAWYVSAVQHSRAASSAYLIEILEKIGINQGISCYSDLGSAYEQACLDAGKNDRIIVFGSFFTVAEVMHVSATRTT